MAAPSPVNARPAAACWVALVLLWFLDITKRLHLPAISAAVAVLAVLATLLWLGGLLWAALRAGGERRATAIALSAVVLLALAVRLAGISHEASGRYYADEGTYYHHASKIDEGEVLRRSFVYPHLTYYLDAITLWTAGLFPGTVARLGEAAFGLSDPLAVSWVLLRLVVALLGALTAVPVFFLGQQLAGLLGALAGAALLIFSPLYNAGSHLNTCDVPSAFFATLCLLGAARLLDRESTLGYGLAGLAAGLAAASKYPAGLAAVAIVAVWLRWRIVRRDGLRGSWGLLWAGLAALAALVGAMPSLLFYPDLAFGDGHGMFFGVHQYGQGGWIGVVKESNGLFYLTNLAESFGWPALVAGVAGLASLPLLSRQGGERRRRLLWLLPFPVLYWGLICAMKMVVKRNLYPALPALAACLGVGLAALVAFAWRPRAAGAPALTPALRATAVLVVAACFALPVWATAQQAAGLVQPTTRELAADWMHRHLPPGARIVKEAYTPDFDRREFAVRVNRFAGRFTLEEIRDRDNDYLLLASDAYQRFLNPEITVKPHQRQIGLRYQEILDRWHPLAEWVPSDTRLGPILKLYRLEPLPADCTPEQELLAAGAFVPDSRPWAMVKGCFPAGAYTLTARGTGLGGEVRVVGLEAGEVGRFPLRGGSIGNVGSVGSAGPLSLPRPGKYFFYLDLSAGGTLDGVVLAPAAP
ncbi:MAG TPA: glycosyltransferase family 39 protein [Thermoanaerobaculia bacterium]|nr:glycosyltransferase family 39 protein [Thermoanaerobaculia bacterium]